MNYSHHSIEKKWRAMWQKNKVYEPNLKNAKRPFYNLMMFPYPSAEGLHVGNMYAFVGSDIYGRFQRMRGNDVFEPIGLDGFGIHSENYAIKANAHPMKLAVKTEKRFYEQLSSIGNGFAWNERLETYDPEYYKWTQWLFLQIWKRGLAYRKKALVNWCSSCATVLADEQVIGGMCERCDSEIIKKELEQWFFSVTKYAEKLLENIDGLDWSEKVKIAQRNWIGKSEGAEIDFKIVGSKERITVFTTRPDTIFGATYVVVSPEHSCVENSKDQILNYNEVQKYATEARKKSEADRIREDGEKTGVLLKGIKAMNPASGEQILIFVADYVLSGYGTGAIMAVPAHDQRDFRFAKKFDLPITMVICPHYPEPTCPILDDAYSGEGHLVASGKFNGMKSEEARGILTSFVGGRKKTTYRIRDWLISRQRYWGPPIPMIHCERCGWVPVSEKNLPVKLPFVKKFRSEGGGKSPLGMVPAFYAVKCPRCKGVAKRETDVSDTFLDSAWYFFRYLDVKNKKAPFEKGRTKKWLPVHMYIGGAEHSVLHLLYTRFITMVLKDSGLIDFEEPFAKFHAHGLLIKDGAKMSKSKGNVVNPDEYIKKYGADAFRMYLMFLGPFTEGGDFRDSGIVGITRFLNRVWGFVVKNHGLGSRNQESMEVLEGKIHHAIKKITEDIENLRYNTAISALMILLNAFEDCPSVVSVEHIKNFLKLLAPFAPFISEELWSMVGGKKSTTIHHGGWPDYEERFLQRDMFTLIIQINGKVRDQFEVSSHDSQKKIETMVLSRDKIKQLLVGKVVQRIIFVPGRLINIVLSA
ncbi:MAG: leucine--tRNA ligase [Patescibacteria group bacterium]